MLKLLTILIIFFTQPRLENPYFTLFIFYNQTACKMKTKTLLKQLSVFSSS